MSDGYVTINKFGCSSYSSKNNPLSTCAVTSMESGFNNTLGSNGICGPESKQCQLFMRSYCADKWDGVCEYVSKDTQVVPNALKGCSGDNKGGALTKGQILIRNTAAERFLVAMSGNCKRVYEPFDPTVADSPLVSTWVPVASDCGSCNSGGACIPIYGVDPKTIDKDIVMNKVLDQPWIAYDILVNIYNNAKSAGTLGQLRGTRLGSLFENSYFVNTVVRGGR